MRLSIGGRSVAWAWTSALSPTDDPTKGNCSPRPSVEGPAIPTNSPRLNFPRPPGDQTPPRQGRTELEHDGGQIPARPFQRRNRRGTPKGYAGYELFLKSFAGLLRWAEMSLRAGSNKPSGRQHWDICGGCLCSGGAVSGQGWGFGLVAVPGGGADFQGVHAPVHVSMYGFAGPAGVFLGVVAGFA
ncbi:UNVERIFIED_CONTAM: hypothetical protein ABIE34_001250 [Jeotgalibacillus campisalis]